MRLYNNVIFAKLIKVYRELNQTGSGLRIKEDKYEKSN